MPQGPTSHESGPHGQKMDARHTPIEQNNKSHQVFHVPNTRNFSLSKVYPFRPNKIICLFGGRGIYFLPVLKNIIAIFVCGWVVLCREPGKRVTSLGNA